MRETETGPTTVGQSIVGPLRQPDGHGAGPASQFVSLETVLHNLLERLEREMNEKAITKP